MSLIERSAFVALFNRGGYVLDFSTGDFDAFTLQGVGVPLCQRYGLSKGKSLMAYIDEADDYHCLKLLSYLLEYYELYFQKEINGDNSSPYDKTDYAVLYRKCSKYIEREKGDFVASCQKSDMEVHFTSEYMKAQIDIMFAAREANPTEAIGKAKELVESCCKSILEENNQPYDRKWDTGKLVRETMASLNISASDINENQRAGNTVKQILGSLTAVVQELAELRNSYGSGHGKSDSYKGLSPRHSKLAVGASATLVEYLWDAHMWRRGAQCQTTCDRIDDEL